VEGKAGAVLLGGLYTSGGVALMRWGLEGRSVRRSLN
jgi:hypothetical protein